MGKAAAGTPKAIANRMKVRAWVTSSEEGVG